MTLLMSRIPASYQSFPLTLLSWNISNAHPSYSTPDSARRSEESPRLIREECLRPNANANAPSSPPDIIALQECPYPSFGEEEFGQSGYVSMGTQQSHCGYVDLLVRKELAIGNNARPIRTVREHNLPSVAATIVLPNETKIAASSSHLAPFKDGAFQRITQCMTLMDLLNDQADNCILLGDFNTRAAEDSGIENACGGGWIDAWKETGSKSDAKFSWNSFANMYHEGGFKFRARFDRSYVRGEALSVTQFGFIGNNYVEKKGDYLSDHFGLMVGLDVTSNASEEKEIRGQFMKADGIRYQGNIPTLPNGDNA